MNIYSHILKPVMSEKSSNQQGKGQYAFFVRRETTKIDVKNAIKAIYGAEVKDVKAMVSPKKTRLVGARRLYTKRAVMKKVIVTLKGKQTIDPHKLTEKKK
ncbi:MAG: 50S ribosomal protein L23 [Candidatus Gracilibacteria bacterium]